MNIIAPVMEARGDRIIRTYFMSVHIFTVKGCLFQAESWYRAVPWKGYIFQTFLYQKGLFLKERHDETRYMGHFIEARVYFR